MDRRLEFVRLALAPGANRSELCRRFAGFYRYAKVLETVAGGIASGSEPGADAGGGEDCVCSAGTALDSGCPFCHAQSASCG